MDNETSEPEFHTHTPNGLLTLHGFVCGWTEQYGSNFGSKVVHIALEGDAYMLIMSDGGIETFDELSHARAFVTYGYHYIGTYLPVASECS